MSITKRIALLGNPNSGKSSLFNRLTGLQQRVGNFPGVTVERRTGTLTLPNATNTTLIDLPGVYSLYPSGEEERVACQILRHPSHSDYPDLLLTVVDATQLQRGLVLLSQVIDLGIPTVLVLNMSDLLAKDKVVIDTALLAQKLQIPVISISALTGEGLNELKKMLEKNITPTQQRIFTPPPDFQYLVEETKQTLQMSGNYATFQALMRPDEFLGLKPEQNQYIKQRISPQQASLYISDEMLLRHDRMDALRRQVISHLPSSSEKLSNYIDRILVHRVWGYLIFGAILLLVFQAIFSWASYPMDAIDYAFGQLSSYLKNTLPSSLLTDLLADGIVTGIGGIVIFVPQIALLFFFIALLEESGYMSRIIFLLDRLMRPFGFSGRAIVPLVGGMACAVPSIMMARSIPNPKERLIAIMVTPLMSCSARVPIYVLLIGMFVPPTAVWGIFTLQGLAMTGMYVLGFVMALASAFVFKKVLRHQDSGIYIAEMPIYRMPRWKNIALIIYQKCSSFVLEAGKIILVISIILWAAVSFAPSGNFAAIDQRYDALLTQIQADTSAVELQRNAEKIQASYAGMFGKAIEPLIAPLGFDWKIGIALLTSFAAREVFVGSMATIYGASSADDNPQTLLQQMRNDRHPITGKPIYTPATALSLILFYAFAMQCMSTLAVTRRETGSWKWSLIMIAYMTALAYVAAWLGYRLLS